MKKLEINKTSNNANPLDIKIESIKFDFEKENPIDEIIYILICAEDKRTKESDYNRFQELSRLEYAKRKLTDYIKSINKSIPSIKD